MPQSSRRTRERQLAKLAERRRRARTRQRRQRILAISLALAVALGGLGFAGYAFFLNNPKKKPSASPTHTPSPTPSATPAGVACGASVPKASQVEKKTYAKAPRKIIDPKKTYTATLRTSCGTIVLRLDQKLSPNTVNSFVFLAGKRFFDGQVFHRIHKDFVIQGGDPTGLGSGGPGYQTVDPPAKDTKYPVGVVAMAKTADEAAGTAGSQFFIVIGQEAQLPAEYAIIGKVIKGQDVAEKIGALPILNGATDGRPTQNVYIDKLTIKVS